MTSTRSKVAIMAAMSVIAASVIGGCAKQEESKPSTTAPTTEAHQPGGRMMTGNVEKDMQMMGDMMMKELGQKDANYEDRFINLMIPHHEAAIMMAKDAIEKTNRPELKQMAQEIIVAQEKEIAKMREWQKQWYDH